jgi:catechol 2,3-dioxygenase
MSNAEYGIAPPQYRLPGATHIGRVRLQVSDLPTSTAYYEALGLRLIDRADTSATLGANGDGPVLLELHTAPGVLTARPGAIGLFHFAILLPDRASLGQFAVHASDLRLRVGMADHAVSQSFYLWDPDGLGIEIYADRPAAEWRHHGRELHMTTEPLDVDGLMAIAGGQPWNGMPAGTRIGHMHLTVGDLTEGERFYHRALGFDKTVWTYPGALFMAAGGYHHHLGTNVWSDGAPAREHEARLLDWEVVVPRIEDVAAASASLREQGFPVSADPDGARIADPWGTAIRIVNYNVGRP